MKIGYKVVRKVGGELLSTSSYTKSSLTISYKVGEITLPQHGPLFVFGTIEDAKRFVVNTKEYPIYKCVYEDYPDKVTRICSVVDYPISIASYWTNIPMQKFFSSIPIPSGTVFAKSLILLEEISS